MSLRLGSLVLILAVLAPRIVHADLVLRPQFQNVSGPVASAATGPFDIQVSFLSAGPDCKGGISPSAQHMAAFATAEATWESLVIGYKEVVAYQHA